MNRCTLLLAALCLAMCAAASAVPIEFVTVGDAGNTANANTYGDVAYTFKIQKYEFTNAQYAAFLNAVDPQGLNPLGIYNPNMGSNVRGGITNTGATSGAYYATKENMGDKPVNYVSWFEAAEVANWLHHGGQTYATTESGSTAMQTGAYTLNRTDKTFTAYKNPGALYWVPTADEWAKAAFYKGGGTDAGYWLYATKSDTTPTAVTASVTGVGSAGDAGNYANYSDNAIWNEVASVTTIGTNGGPGTYGTFDMNGNLSEWNSADGLPQSMVNRWGGSWTNARNHLENTYTDSIAATTESQSIGFRIAHTAVIVPEPSTWDMAIAGAGVLALSSRRKGKR